MKNGRLSITARTALVAMVFVSATASTEGTESARGAELLAPLKKELKQALVSGMQKGPLNAISVCKDKAPAIANSLSIVCLACHGKSLAPDVAAQITEAYPEDEATGFDVGDLRGVFWVEYPATE